MALFSIHPPFAFINQKINFFATSLKTIFRFGFQTGFHLVYLKVVSMIFVILRQFRKWANAKNND
jgi:hypothetical protein